jgi:hypothetical protein
MTFASGIYDEDKTYEDGKQYADDKNLLVRFEVRPIKNEFKSTKEGRAIFEDCEYISIITPGSRDIYTTPIDEQYKARFQERYDKWKKTHQDSNPAGTILSEVPWITRSLAAELNYCNVFTIEQLASMSDTDAMRMGLMGHNDLRARAKRFVDAAKGEAPMLQMEAELRARDSTILTLQEQMKSMQAALEKLQKK